MKLTMLSLTLVVSAMCQPKLLADEPFHSLDAEVLNILRAKYPDATLGKNLDKYRYFTRKMRDFIVYRLDHDGDWQSPHREQGPDRAEYQYTFTSRRGNGEERWFLIVAQMISMSSKKPTSSGISDGKWHIRAMISTPKIDSPEVVVRKLIEVFTQFEKYR